VSTVPGIAPGTVVAAKRSPCWTEEVRMVRLHRLTRHSVADAVPPSRPQRRPIRIMPDTPAPVRLAAFLFAVSVILGFGIWAVILAELF